MNRYNPIESEKASTFCHGQKRGSLTGGSWKEVSLEAVKLKEVNEVEHEHEHETAIMVIAIVFLFG